MCVVRRLRHTGSDWSFVVPSMKARAEPILWKAEVRCIMHARALLPNDCSLSVLSDHDL